MTIRPAIFCCSIKQMHSNDWSFQKTNDIRVLSGYLIGFTHAHTHTRSIIKIVYIISTKLCTIQPHFVIIF